jgi:hypothetical protein
MLLPRMPDLNTCIFTSRLVVFNETFAIGSQTRKSHYLALWNESISGRTRADIASAFHKLILTETDCPNFIFWLDNCSSQNENWVLYSLLLALVNKTDGQESVILLYPVPGHTYMAADSIDGNLEKAIRTKKNVYDMDDLSAVMAGVALNISIIDMSIADFRERPNSCKTRSRSNLIPNFVKGQRKLLFKQSFTDDTNHLC